MTAPLTISAIRTWNTCKKKYWYQYVLGYQPVKKSDALSFGTAMHKELEDVWNNVPLFTRTHDLPESELAKLQVLIIGYTCRWIDDSKKYKVLAVEKQFEIDGFAGKMDLVLLSIEDNKLYVGEHKSTSEDIELGSDYWLKLRLDDQVSMYARAAKRLYPEYDFGGCLYDVIKKIKKEPHKATPIEDRKYKKDGTLYANQRETDESMEEFRGRLSAEVQENPDKFYARRIVTRSESELAEFEVELEETAKEIDSHIKSGRLTVRNPGACFNYHTRCSWHDVCCGIDSLDNKERYTKVDNVNQELADDIDSL